MIPLYELLYGSKIAKQRIVEDFSGDTLNERWTFTDITGAGTGSMSDTVDGGYQIATASLSVARSLIAFNNIRQFDVRSFELFGEVKMDSAVNSVVVVGVASDLLSTMQRISYQNFHQTATTDARQLATYDGTTATSVDLTGVADANWHNVKVSGDATTAKLWEDGDFGAISTANLPASQKMQPRFDSLTRITTSKTSRIRYLECYNT